MHYGVRCFCLDPRAYQNKCQNVLHFLKDKVSSVPPADSPHNFKSTRSNICDSWNSVILIYWLHQGSKQCLKNFRTPILADVAARALEIARRARWRDARHLVLKSLKMRCLIACYMNDAIAALCDEMVAAISGIKISAVNYAVTDYQKWNYRIRSVEITCGVRITYLTHAWEKWWSTNPS